MTTGHVQNPPKQTVTVTIIKDVRFSNTCDFVRHYAQIKYSYIYLKMIKTIINELCTGSYI